jgi:hypothetical protein
MGALLGIDTQCIFLVRAHTVRSAIFPISVDNTIGSVAADCRRKAVPP